MQENLPCKRPGEALLLAPGGPAVVVSMEKEFKKGLKEGLRKVFSLIREASDDTETGRIWTIKIIYREGSWI